MNRSRPLTLANLRAFEAVARLLSFSAAAEEMHLTQSAISRQIKSLEDEIGTSLFNRGTRHVELTGDGTLLLRAVAPALERIDAGVRQLRQSRGRRVVSVTTFASFSALWLIPRLEAFQRAHPDIDIRVSATDALVNLDDSDMDLALRQASPTRHPANGHRLFGEALTPVISPWLAQRIERGEAPPLSTFDDLAGHALTEEDDTDLRPTAELMSWRHWLSLKGLPTLQPRRWVYSNYTYQLVLAALAGQAVTLARMPLVAELMARGELVEPFGDAGRIRSPMTYWLLHSQRSLERPEVMEFVTWMLEQATHTRQLIGEMG